MRRLAHDRVAGGDRRRDLPRHQQQRKVERHDRRHDAERFLDREVDLMRRDRRNRGAVAPSAHLRVVVEAGRDPLDAVDRLDQRLAGLARHQRRELALLGPDLARPRGAVPPSPRPAPPPGGLGRAAASTAALRPRPAIRRTPRGRAWRDSGSRGWRTRGRAIHAPSMRMGATSGMRRPFGGSEGRRRRAAPSSLARVGALASGRAGPPASPVIRLAYTTEPPPHFPEYAFASVQLAARVDPLGATSSGDTAPALSPARRRRLWGRESGAARPGPALGDRRGAGRSAERRDRRAAGRFARGAGDRPLRRPGRRRRGDLDPPGGREREPGHQRHAPPTAAPPPSACSATRSAPTSPPPPCPGLEDAPSRWCSPPRAWTRASPSPCRRRRSRRPGSRSTPSRCSSSRTLEGHDIAREGVAVTAQIAAGAAVSPAVHDRRRATRRAGRPSPTSRSRARPAPSTLIFSRRRLRLGHGDGGPRHRRRRRSIEAAAGGEQSATVATAVADWRRRCWCATSTATRSRAFR